MPAMILVVTLLGSMFQLGLQQIALEAQVFQFARQFGYGLDLSETEKYRIETWYQDHLACVELRLEGMIPLASSHCVIRAGT